MTGRRFAIIEWVLAGLVLIWFVGFLLVGDAPETPPIALGVAITSIFIAPGLVVSLVINGLVHFRRRDRLAISEHVLLGIEALIILLLVLASVYDQTNYGSTTGIGSGFGHWFEWFLPLWIVLGPVALTVMILGLVKKSPRAQVMAPGAAAPPDPSV
jgi:hypothetical protein